MTSSRTDDGGGSGLCECGNKLGDGKIPKDPRYSLSSLSLIVLKCLKLISERKLRRELLVLVHCMRQRLMNLAQLIGVILPNLKDKDYDDKGDNNNGNEANDGNDYGLMQAMNNCNELPYHNRRRRPLPRLIDRNNNNALTNKCCRHRRGP